MRYKSTKFELKALNDNTFEGYASYFNNVDSYDEIIVQGAFKKTLQENKNRIKVLWQHNTSEPIGKPIFMEEDSQGLYVKAQVSMTETGKKAMMLMKDGVVDEMSIGYDVIKDEYKGNKRMLKEVRLWEFSPVTFGANDMAKITGAKNINEILFDIKNANKDDLIFAVKRLNQLLDSLDPSTDNQGEKKEDSEQVQSILKMIKELKQNANT
jgi:HK97 family phage prohead protease